MAKYYSTARANGYGCGATALEAEAVEPIPSLETGLKLLGLVEGEIADAMSQVQASKEWWNAPCTRGGEKPGPGYHVVLRSGKVITVFVGTPYPPVLCRLDCFIQNMR